MAMCRLLNGQLFKLLSAKCTVKNIEIRATTGAGHFFTQERFFGRNFGLKLRVMKLRRKLAGPDKIRKRSEWDNWNYQAELYAFNKRLYENMTEETLRQAFIHESYIQSEEEKRRALDIPTQDVPLDLISNAPLVARGKDLTSDFLKRYLRYCYPVLPEEGVLATHDHLLSYRVLSYVSTNIGTKDLIFTAEYPPNESTLASTMLAIIGTIAADDSVSRAEKFVLDVICMQLIGKDIFEIWDLQDPLSVLNEILQKHGMSQYEPRVIFEAGRNTIESIYNIGLYSDKIFLGRAAGETLAIAEELAAYDCLRKLFQIREAEQPMSSKQVSLQELSVATNSNPVIENWYSEKLRLHKCL